MNSADTMQEVFVLQISRIEMPRANPEKLLDLVEDAYLGKVVLPEFQRSFVWRREDIEELLVSILQGYFIGKFLILDTQPERALFPWRLVEGLQAVNPAAKQSNHSTLRLILDGQQRITSLFYVLHEPKIPLRNSRNPYQFFLRLDSLMEGNIEDAVCGISLADQRRVSEMQQMEAGGKAIKISIFREPNKFYQWLYSEQKAIDTDGKDILQSYHERLSSFMVPVVSITPEIGKENIINIFERINRTGISLSLFDLAAARLYLKGVDLRKLWEDFNQSFKSASKFMKPEFILKLICLWKNKEPKKSVLLDVIDEMKNDDFKAQWELACAWLVSAYERMISPQGYGAFEVKWIPYTTLIVPLAALLREVHDRQGGEDMFRKIDCWYWGSVFMQRYDQAVDTTSFRDVRDISKWMDGAPPPAWLSGFQAEQVGIPEVAEQRSSIYRGVMCLIVRAGARDFSTGQPAEFSTCDDDHIFPKSKYKQQRYVDSVLNHTIISSSSNKCKASKLPSEYLKQFLEKHGGDVQRLQETLDSHLITEQARQAMENDNFDAFIEARKRTLLEEINRHVKYVP